MANVALKTRRTAWDLSWNGNGIGTNMKVSPDFKLKLTPITRAQTGNIVIGHWIDGIEGEISADLADVALDLMTKVCPWLDSAIVVPVPADPTADMYTYAAALVMHPHDMGTDTTEDITFIKALPQSAFNLGRDGKDNDIYKVPFMPYPDRTKLMASPPRLVYGWIGGTAAV